MVAVRVCEGLEVETLTETTASERYAARESELVALPQVERVGDVGERRQPSSAQVEMAAEAERRISQERLLFSFYHDEVTGLPNRTYWRELVRIYLEASRDRGESAE